MAKRKTAQDDLHGLTFDAAKRSWILRITINMGEKVIGKRIRIPMRTSVQKRAMQRKAGAIEALESVGLQVIVRKQKRKSEPDNSAAFTTENTNR